MTKCMKEKCEHKMVVFCKPCNAIHCLSCDKKWPEIERISYPIYPIYPQLPIYPNFYNPNYYRIYTSGTITAGAQTATSGLLQAGTTIAATPNGTFTS